MIHNSSLLQTFIAQELNENQQAAVTHAQGPLLVIAVAGSGKTRIITARIAYLLQEKHVLPSEIIALTFTNKAAAEMRERIIKFTGSHRHLPFIGTFHSYCLYLLKKNRHLLPFDTFSILDEDDKRSLLQALLKKSPLYKKYTPQQFSYQISLFKNQTAGIDFDTGAFINNRILLELFLEYEKEKKNSKCFDFDDLLLEVTKLLKNPTFKEEHQHKVRHVLIDEYQDTNTVQHHFLKEIALVSGTNKLAIDSLCVVGDEDQSIYSWRGATVDNIMGFTRDFKDTTAIKIEQNYRSRLPILQTATHIIKNNINRNEKKVWSEKQGNDCIRVIQCLSSYQEADIIGRLAQILHKKNALPQTAVLYRTHAQSRTLEEALIKFSIPYTLIGGVRFYERKEIKDIIAYLRLVINPFDRVAFTRAIGIPTRGLGDKFVEHFFEIWDQQPNLSFLEIGNTMLGASTLATSKKTGLHSFLNIFTSLHANSEAVTTVSTLLTTLDYRNYLKSMYETQEAQERLENIKELMNALHYFSTQGKITIEQALDEIALLQEKADKDAQKEAGITLMTLHAAKGLEFDTVILPGLEEGLFPSTRTTYDLNEIEEERRLLYVGVTRAREKLLITHARHRQMYGKMEESAPSRFLKELPANHAKHDTASAWHQHEVVQYFSQWLGHSSATEFSFKPPVTTYAPASPQKYSTSKDATFKKHQTVKHPVFGIGIICDVEEKEHKTFVTAQFKVGLKKIDSSFLQHL